jgi:hypothetical protein
MSRSSCTMKMCFQYGILACRTRPSPQAMRSLCASVLLDTGLDSLGVCANDLANLLTALEEDESRHGADAEFLRNVGDLVDVELVEACVGVLFGEPMHVKLVFANVCTGGNLLDNGGCDHLAGSAPCGKAVKDNEVVLVLHRLPVVVHPVACVSVLIPRQMTSLLQARHDRNVDLRLEVVYALLMLAHFAGGGEKLWGEERSVEVCGRSGVDSSCSQARGCKYGSSEPGG